MKRLPKCIRCFWVFLSVALWVGHLAAQPSSEPHVRWLVGGTIFGPNLVAFSHDGASLFTHSAVDIGLKRWDFASRQLLSVTRVPATKTGMAGLSRDQQLVAFLSTYDDTLSVCRVTDGTMLWTVDYDSPFPVRPGFSTDNILLLTCGYGGPIRVWRVVDGSVLNTAFTTSGGASNEFAWAEFVNEKEFIAVGRGEAVRFNALTGEAVWRQPDPALNSYYSAALSPDASEFCASTTNGLSRYSTATGHKIADVYSPPAAVWTLAYSPNGATLAVALDQSDPKSIELRNLTNGTLVRVLTGLPESPRYVNALAWSPDGQHLVAATTYSGCTWSLASDGTSEPLFPLVQAHRSPARFSHDQQWLLKESWPDEVVLLNPTNGTVTHRWSAGPESQTDLLCPSPVANTVLIPGGQGRVQIRSLPAGALMSTVTLISNATELELEFSADGSRLLAMDSFGGKLAVFSTPTWLKLREVSAYSPLRARITPDGSRFLVGLSGSTTRVWDVAGNAAPLVIPAGGILEFGVNPEEFWTLGKDGWMDLWRLSDGLRLGGFKIPVTNYYGILSPDRKLVLTSQAGQPMKIWRTDTGELVGQWGGPGLGQFIRFSTAPDGRWLVATRQDSSLVAFDFPFIIQEFSLSGGQLHFRAAGAPGPFQLESRTPDDSLWAPVGNPFQTETSTPLGTDPARYFRLSRPD